MSSVSTPSDLNKYLVPLPELECTEYHFRDDNVDFSKPPKDHPTISHVTRLITALSNSSGGVVSLYGQQVYDAVTVNEWTLKFSSMIEIIFQQDEYMNNIKILDHNGNNIHAVHILVKRATHLVTYSYGLYKRYLEKSMKVNNISTAASVLRASSSQNVLQQLSSLKWNTPVNIVENQHTELKFWKVKNLNELKKRLNDDRNQNSIFAFLNNPRGGTIFIGIEENKAMKKCIIQGQKLSTNDETAFTEIIEQMLIEDSSGSPRVWGTPGRIPVRGQDWNVSFDEVTHCPDADRRVIIKVQLYHFPGGVFKHTPEAYKVRASGEVYQLSMEDWCTAVLQSVPETRKPASEDQRFAKMARSTTASVETSSRSISKSTSSKKISNTPIEKLDNPSLQLSLKITTKLSFTDNTKDWAKNLRFGQNKLNDFIESLTSITDSSFAFIPDKSVILSASADASDMEDCLSDIESTHAPRRGVAIAAKEWMKLIDSSQTWASRPPHHIIDILSVDDQGELYLWVICAQKDDIPQNTYMRDVGRQIKHHLLADLPLKYSSCTCIQTRLWIPGVSHSPSDLENECTEYFKTPEDQVDGVQRGLGILLLSKKTSVRNTLGDRCLVTLTTHQATKIIGADISEYLFIRGAPGSGKTIILLFMCEHEFESDKCVLICTNPCLKSYYEFQNLKHVVLINTDKEMIDFLSSDNFDSNEGILIDDAHLLHLAKDTWLQLFNAINTSDNKRLIVCFDNDIQNYAGNQGTCECTEAFSQFRHQENINPHEKPLTDVHRNSQKITSFLSQTASKINKKHKKLVCSHNEVGDDVEVLRVDRLRRQGPDNGLVQLIGSLTDREKLLSGDEGVYEAKHVVVLVDGEDPDQEAKFFRQLLSDSGYQTQGADVFPVTGITITPVASFSGLEARVVLLVAPERFTRTNQPDTELGIHNPRYKAFVASRGVYRVIFIIETELNQGLMKSMEFEELQTITRYRPDYKRAVLTHTWSLPDSSYLSLSVAMCPVSGRVVLANDKNLYILTAELQESQTITVGDGELGGVAVGPQDTVYTTDYYDNTLLSLEMGATTPRTLAGGEGTGRGEFDRPRGVAVSPSGELYVVDSMNFRVPVLSAGGQYLRQIGSRGSGPGMFEGEPEYVAVSPSGTVAISDYEGNIHLYTEQGTHTRTVTKAQHGQSLLRGLSFDSQDNLLVAGGLHGVAVLGPDMERTTTVDTHSQGEIEDTQDVAVAPDGSLLVAGWSPGPVSVTAVVQRYDVPPQSDS